MRLKSFMFYLKNFGEEQKCFKNSNHVYTADTAG